MFINPLLRMPQRINDMSKAVYSSKTYRLITSTTTTTTTMDTTDPLSSSHSFSLSKYSHIPSFSTATKDYLNRLREQLHFYAVVEIRSQKFLITKNDLVITHRLCDVDIGDEIKLNRVTEIGSKDYTIKGQPLVSEAFYNIKATVVEQPKGPFIEIFKKKRRNRHKKRVTHKQTYTVLRITEVAINKLK